MTLPRPRSGRAHRDFQALPSPNLPSPTLLGATLLGLALLSGCAVQIPGPGAIPAGFLLAAEAIPAPPGTLAPGTLAPGACWGDETIPAIIETVTEQQEIAPAVLAADGAMIRPARYQTRTRQRIISERREAWFRVPCPALATDPAFVETLQRSLKVRGFYRGAISGTMDAATQGAIRKYQAPQGLDSGTLSLAAARQLGLVAFDREDVK